MNPSPTLHLFEGFGIELEYMIVDRSTLDVLPASDRVIHQVAGAFESEIELGDIAWSNELVLHVIELKTNGPAGKLEGLAARFDENVRRIEGILEPLGGALLPTAMHPWMDPFKETRLWPHEHNAIYEAFDRIFDCRGHGWANLQSMHLNLPFSGDEEFGLLHGAIRMLLPILPALAASSPLIDGRPTCLLDNRLEVYRMNSAKIPSITGQVVPEPARSRGEYEEKILGRIYRDLTPFDPDGVLRHEFVNSRGAIARFDRSAIEIRMLDVQECPRADLAIAAAIVAALKTMIAGRWPGVADQGSWPVEPLAAILRSGLRDAEEAVIEDRAYLEALGVGRLRAKAGEVWRSLLDRASKAGHAVSGELEWPIERILAEGSLARRIIQRIGADPSRGEIEAVYRELARCLVEGRMLS